MPGESIGTMRQEMPLCFGASGSERKMPSPNWQYCAPLVHTFWPLSTKLVAVALGSRAQAGEVGAGVGLAPELAPDLVAAEHRRQVAAPAARSVPWAMIVGPIMPRPMAKTLVGTS